jgi:hypothetical protein
MPGSERAANSRVLSFKTPLRLIDKALTRTVSKTEAP